MAKKQFKGTINIDVRESTPDWELYAEPLAPEGAPNVLYIVWDDVGFSAMEPFGGLIETPNMQRIAEAGLRYTQFHTTALCSPTRSCLLTGRNATSNGMACITEATTGFPGSNGRIPFEHAFISETLVEQGWNTYAVGKWHLTPSEECNMASSKRHWPLGRGFERFYGFIGAEMDQWYPDLTYDNHPEDQPYLPKDGYHLSKDLTDKAIRFIRDAKTIAPEKPWFTYFCPGAGHAPHHVWSDWADKYKGTFDMGYEAYREVTLERMKQLGIVPQETDLTPMNPLADMTGPNGEPFPEGELVRPWDALSEDEKKLFRRMAEVYAGFISYTDHEIGRLLDYLEESGQLENTIIVVLSDNGASGEGGPNGSVNENKFFNAAPDTIEENIKFLDVLGSEKTYNHYPLGWAMAFNTPNKMWKRWSSYEGGIADPFIVAWPKGIRARGEIRQQYIHAIDIVPTLYDCLGITPPEVVNGYTQAPIEGVTFRQTFDDASAASHRETQFYVMLGTRGIWHQGWHANTTHVPTPSNWGHFTQDTWELYHLDEDRSQAHNVADQFPQKLEELKNLWWVEAGKYNGLPLEDRGAVAILSSPRPQLSKPRDHYVYYPDVADVPEAVAVNIRNRSYSILAEAELQTPEAAGILFAHGGRFGGHALYLKDGKLIYVYNWLGEVEQKVTSSATVPTGKSVLGVKFNLKGADGGVPTGTATLYINDKKVGSAQIKTQIGNFSLVGEGLCVGRDGGQPVSSDYESPFAFVGGVIKQVTVDVSGQHYVDLEKEAIGAFARD